MATPKPDTADALHGASLAGICLCIALWIRAKTVSQQERGNAERRALFVGLWPAMFWLLGDAAERRRRGRLRPRRLGRRLNSRAAAWRGPGA